MIRTATGLFTDRGLADFRIQNSRFSAAASPPYPGVEFALFGETFRTDGTAPVKSPPTSVVLEPAAAENRVGSEHCVTATVRDVGGNLTPGVTVFFTVSGAHTRSEQGTTDANGQAQFCYTATDVGADTIRAVADADDDGQPEAGEPVGAAGSSG